MAISTSRDEVDIHKHLAVILDKVDVELAGFPKRANSRIHKIRVLMKKFRALLRLSKEIIPVTVFERLDRLARSVKNAFANERDDLIQSQLALETFGRETGKRVILALALRTCHQSRHQSPKAPDVSKVKRSLSQLRKTLAPTPRIAIPAALAIAERQRTIRAVQRAMWRCRDNRRDDRLFHRWRTRVKRLHYQTSVLKPNDPQNDDSVRALGSLLGKHHDLSALESRMHAARLSPSATRALSRQKQQLTREIFALGRALFARQQID